MELAESRRRFAEAVSGSQAQQQQVKSQSQSNKDASKQQSAQGQASGKAASSSSAPVPLDHTLSAPALYKLATLGKIISEDASRELTALELARGVTDLEAAMVRARMGGLARDEAVLCDAVMELEDVPMDSLSPQLQKLKRGFSELPPTPNTPDEVERRINEVLQNAGERTIKISHSAYRLDHSTVPPTRVVKTEEDRKLDGVQDMQYFAELRKRKPRLQRRVAKIMSELDALLPAHALPKGEPMGPMQDGVIMHMVSIQVGSFDDVVRKLTLCSFAHQVRATSDTWSKHNTF